MHARLPSRSLFARPSTALAFLPLALAFASCEVSVHGHTTPPPYVPPSPPPPPVYDEGEPNETAWLAPWFGVLHSSDLVYVEGHSTDDGTDPQDGLAFSVSGPARIDFTLYVDDPWTDLDVWVFDPLSNQFVGAFTAPYGDEVGTLWLADAREFHLVVFPADGASWWTLAVESSATYSAAALAETSLPALPESLETYGAAGPLPPLDASSAEERAGARAD